MKNVKKILSLLLALAMVVTMLPATLAVEPNEWVEGDVIVEKVENPGVDLKQDSGVAAEKAIENPYSPEDIVRVIVVLEGKSLLEQGFTTAQISANTGAVTKQVNSIKAQQESVFSRVESVVYGLKLDSAAKTVTLRHSFNVTTNGFSVDVPYAAIGEIAKLDGVKSAFMAPQYTVPEDMTSADDTYTPSMYATSDFFGSAQTWTDLGYTGEGMRVAIIDTGLDTDHPSFVDDPTLTETSLTVEEIAGVLENLNAYKMYYAATGETLTAEELYVSGKIPFAFNYKDVNLDPTHDNDLQGDHGSHVTGIIAANKIDTTEVVGVAPDAQVIVMKVFGASGGPYADELVAVLEDCFLLNVDAVNMSLGSTAGFSSSGYDWIDAVYANIENADMIVSISAGNEYSAAYGNGWGTNTNLTTDPDIGLVGSPGTWGGTMVASMENTHFMIDYMMVGDTQMIYYDATYAFAYTLAPTEDVDYPYVMVPGVGSVEDFAQVDVNGKIAVVQRGEINFTDKQLNAANAGAVACIVYDNVYTDEIVYMVDGGYLPNVFISLANGEAMAAAADENGQGVVTVKAYGSVIPCVNPSAGQMSDFSSWGTTPDLQMGPDVTAPGGNIYSCYMDGEYGMMSGTSMSAPHIAGMAALVLQHLHEAYPDMGEAEMHNLAEALIMSTATPVVEYNTGDYDVPYSPRKQGAGLANVYDAITSTGYLTVNGDKPKVSLGDDDEKTGVYTFSFEINNLSDEAKAYALTADVITDYVNDLYNAYYGLPYFMGEMSLPLDAAVEFSTRFATNELAAYDLNCDGSLNRNDVQLVVDAANGLVEDVSSLDLNGDGVVNTVDAQQMYELLNSMPVQNIDGLVTVPANGSATIDVKVTLSDWDRWYIETYYPNGIYVEGFVRCWSLDEDADLSLPFMAFYGDWSKAGKVFDSGWYYEDELFYERYVNVLFTNFYGDDYGFLLGMNPYMDEVYDPAHNVVSPNGDGYNDYVSEIYLGMMRSAETLDINWVDENGEILYGAALEHARKSYYYAYYDIVLPFMWTDYGLPAYNYMDEAGAALPDNTKVNLVIDAYLDDGDAVVDDNITLPIVVDCTAPEISNIQYLYNTSTDQRVLGFTVTDNYDAAALISLTEIGDAIEYLAVDGELSEDGETCSFILDVSGYDSSFYLCAADYGVNETYYKITFPGENNVDENKFYGYVHASTVLNDGYLYLTDGYSGWNSFYSADNLVQHTSIYDGETAVMAAEYIDGYVVGIDADRNIFVMEPGVWNRTVLGTFQVGYYECPALDMAYDYTTDTLYVLSDEPYAGYGGHLLTLDYMTGEVTDLGVVAMPEGHAGQMLTLACDNDGVLYGISYVGDTDAETYYEDTGDLYIFDLANYVEPEDWWSSGQIPVVYVGETGYVPELYQSMTVDHETNELYWAAYPGYYNSYASGAYLFTLDKATGAITGAVPAENYSQMTALFKPYDSGADIIPNVDLEAVVLSSESLAMGIGTAAQLTVSAWPFNSELGEVTWTSSDESVAVVDGEGFVVALSEGTAYVTATAANGMYAECKVDVVDLKANLTVFDMGSEYVWQSFNVNGTADAEYLYDAVNPINGVTAAAYFNGYVYASEQAGAFYRLDAETMQGEVLGSPNTTLIAMAFNYADGFMYGIQQSGNMMGNTNNVVRINLSNGQVEQVASFGDMYNPLGGMAIDHEGNFYSYCGNNYTYGFELVKWTVEDGAMVPVWSWSMDQWQSYNFTSMTYSDVDNGLYWMNDTNALYWIDMESLTEENYEPRVVYTGSVPTSQGYAMSMGMFTVPAEEPEVPFVAPEAVTVPESYILLAGGSVSANVVVAPWNSYPEITYVMADESVATVENGTITGVSVGETVLTVSVEGWDTVYEIPVQVTESAGYVNGFLISDFGYGSNLFINFSDLNPTEDYGVIGEVYDFNVFAGAYYDGKIYAYGQDNYGDYDYKNFFLTFDAETFECTMGEKIHYTLRDMAVDYTTGNLYAIAEDGALAGAVAVVDPETGAVTIVGDTGRALAAMTIDAEGNMYVISEDGNLYQADKDTAELTLVGPVGVDVGALYQSMHYDMNTGNTYWAQVANDQTSSLRLVDLVTGATSSLGTICPSGVMLSAMYTVPGAEPTEPDMDNVEITGIELTEKTTVAVGDSVELEATVLTAVELKAAEIAPMSVGTPSLAPVDVTVVWASSDESVATVDENGVVTGVAAGTVVITASAGGFTAECEVVVTAEARKFYAYDKSNTQWVSFEVDNGEFVQVESTNYWGEVSYNDVWYMNTTVERDDAEGEVLIAASTYTGETIYAYGEDGTFFTVDPVTFERTAVGNGIAGETFNVLVEEYDWTWDEYYTYEVECAASIIDLTYDCVTEKLYAVVQLVNEDSWIENYSIYEVNAEDGTITAAYESTEIKPANLYVENGVAYFVDSYMSGMLTVVDLNNVEAGFNQMALTQGYWGDVDASVSLIKDYLTGQMYAIRDLTDTSGSGYYDEEWNYIFTPWDGVTGAATLCTYNLSDADIAELGRIGYNLVVNGLFIR